MNALKNAVFAREHSDIMLIFCEKYHIMKRKSLIKNKKGDEEMDKYVCVVCGYIYDPAVGDPDNGIAPGISFDDLPEEWVCPVCGAPQNEFDLAE